MLSQQDEAADPAVLRQALRDALAGLRHLQTRDPQQYTNAILYLFYFILHRKVSEQTPQDLLDILAEEDSQNREIIDMAESIMEITRQQGIEKGIEQGREQGEIQGKQASLLKLLQHRFTSLPDAIITHVRSLDTTGDLDELFEKGLTAERLEDLPWKPTLPPSGENQ